VVEKNLDRIYRIIRIFLNIIMINFPEVCPGALCGALLGRSPAYNGVEFGELFQVLDEVGGNKVAASPLLAEDSGVIPHQNLLTI
jgi:hypothetical protein